MSHAVTNKRCRDYVCIDFETSSLSINTAEIIEIGAVKVRDGEVSDCYNTLVRPFMEITAGATDVNGLTEDDVKDAPRIYDVLKDFLEFIGDDTLLGHNIAAFDLPILYRILAEDEITLRNDHIDTLILAKELLPALPSTSLQALCNYYDIENMQAHRALGDCFATIEVYNAMINNKAGNINNVQKKKSSTGLYFSQMTNGTRLLVRLTGIIEGIICDEAVNEKKITYLKNWLSQNTMLEGNYQYDFAVKTVNNALEMNEIDEAPIIAALRSIVDPVGNQTDSNDCIIDFSGKTVCLTGEFESGSRTEISNRLEQMGAVVNSAVLKSLDYLIVGGNGSHAWASGNYGTKVKKALELQRKGSKVQIVREADVFKG